MKMHTMVTLGALLWSAVACNRQARIETETREAREQVIPSAPPDETRTATVAPAKRLFLDVHELGKGKVTAQAVAEAHQKDLATQAKYGVDFKAYWVDEKEGKIYCLAEAPSAEATRAVHREAHGLLADKIVEVTPDSASWTPTPNTKLFLDFHFFGAGKVSAQGVREAHQKDLAAGPSHHVRFLNYWLDQANGTVVCLSEAPNAEAAVATHREAHGLIPDTIEAVAEGR